MTNNLVPLKDALRLSIDSVLVEPSETYPIAGVYSFGRGLLSRAPILGSETTYKTFNRLHKDDFVLSQLKGWEGALAKVTSSHDGWFLSPQFPTFRTNPNRLDISYLDWYCKQSNVWEELRNTARGMGARRDSVSPERFLALTIPLPPLPEQRRIVARIEELAAKINEARGLRQRAVQETERIYAARLSQCMEPNGNGWVRETVADVIVSMGAGWSPQCDDIPARDGQWGVLKTTSVQWCEFRPYENKALPATLNPVREFAVEEGDVLVTRAGPRKRVGVVAAVRKSEPRLTISDKLIRLRPILKKIEPRFLELSLASPFSQEHLVDRKTGLADAQVNISQSILRATPVAYPSLFEQRRVVTELDALQSQVHALQKVQAETAAELDSLLPSILDKAFQGKL